MKEEKRMKSHQTKECDKFLQWNRIGILSIVRGLLRKSNEKSQETTD